MGERKIKITNQYVKSGLTLFIVGVALIAAFYTLNHPDMVLGAIEKINDILFPFYLGAVMAYLMCPVYNSTTRAVYKITKGRFAHPISDLKVARAAASLVSVVTIVAVVSGLVWMVLPDLWESIMGLIANLPDTVTKVSNWVQLNLDENPQLAAFLGDKLDSIYDTAISWAQTKLVPNVEAILSNVSVGVIGTFGVIIDVFVALIICVYILNSKEIFVAQTKKMILALFKPQRAENIFELGRITNETFGGFINGKIIDSIIIGIICFIAMTLLKLPLTMLISVVIGVTNVIPFFGPFIGAIPSIIILLLIDPVAALKFAIMVLALQQLDGNIIGPKILGKSTNLASFWVMFAIIVAGGLFGFVGMVLGVPVFAVVYTYIRRGINNRLAEKELPTDTLLYEDFSKYKLEDFDKEAVFGEGNNDK
ncbi:MAG: AI-2E family transporter [Firmicutes bacterium]|nr:AI-2E family transporter [Bacillota bacterium]MBR6585269.1 AI-2E family transporter [Bacillota bacterium]